MFSSDPGTLDWFRGRRVTVMGLGAFGGGRGVTEFLCAQGAEVTVTDHLPEEKLAKSVAELSHLPVRFVLGEHRDEDLFTAELVVVNPAVPRTAKLVQRMAAEGVRLETEMNLFFKHCRGRICGITGSNGKTTTSYLTAAMAEAGMVGRKVRLGGNLGRSLLPDVTKIEADDWVILELSSFQLEDLRGIERRPEISIVVNVTPNHLDRHGTFEDYAAAKREILNDAAETAELNLAVLNLDDDVCAEWARSATREVLGVSTREDEPTKRVFIDLARGLASMSQDGRPLVDRDDLRLVGDFNFVNASLAATAARAMGASPKAIASALREFRGVAHRLEHVAEQDGVTYLNDSIATTPESTIAALRALGPSVVLIAGGASKGCSWDELARAVGAPARAAVRIGQTAPDIEAAIVAAGGADRVHRVETLSEAVPRARDLAEPGDHVVLSPACASYDQFQHFEERGEAFRELVENHLTEHEMAESAATGRYHHGLG